MREDNSIYCTKYTNDIHLFWQEISTISSYINNIAISDEYNKDDIKKAKNAVERFDYWDKNLNLRNHDIFAGDKVLNDLFKDAVLYVIKYGIDDESTCVYYTIDK